MKATHLGLLATMLFLNDGAAQAPAPATSKEDAVSRAKLNIGPLGWDGVRYDLPATLTGTGPHDFYSLFSKASFGPGGNVYGIGIATEHKHMSSADAQLSVRKSEALTIQLRQELPAGLGKKIEYIEAHFNRSFLENAAANGARFSLRSSRAPLEFVVPGWMFNALIEVADEHDYKRKAEHAAQARRESTRQRRKSYLDAHPETTDRIKQAITEGKLTLGMSAAEATASWGTPEKVNRTVNIYSVHEQWIYGNTYVYFEDGILTSWQDSR